mmetsp:Transcript_2347/g.4766  ORF Transcript_2347/g.4766 Transcript_2347/m.4766 type:complete len:213 (-) Transcript_2347:222-860(-)|eukprot:CAMPEP_0118933082 /NCGR_PEP_ID=MMETSP1169-20130426/11238_1 /TAXON_ID=36882 /ORGANISM="Pyramimonas obovata, Strain CCMP722" /LENGTH=212 /DNA_ID=CAMNT_0006875805 /DNA_START=58 /DNA_END=696 /DNA_ORIENTATION=+
MSSATLNCVSLSAKAHVSGRELQNKRRVKCLARSKSACVASLEQAKTWGESACKLALTATACTMLTIAPAHLALAIPQTSTCATEICDGNDYSNKDLRQEFYTKGSVKYANFSNSNLERVSLFGANLMGANLSGANLTYSDLGQANLTNADLRGARLEGAIVSSTRFDGAKIEGSDWTDVIVRSDINKELCAIASGTNPVTGVDTKDSLLCF